MMLLNLLGGLLGGSDDSDEQDTNTETRDPETCDHEFPDWPDEHPYAWRLHLTTPVEDPTDNTQLLATRERGCQKCGKRQSEHATIADFDVAVNEDGSLASFDVTEIDEQHQ